VRLRVCCLRYRLPAVIAFLRCHVRCFTVPVAGSFDYACVWIDLRCTVLHFGFYVWIYRYRLLHIAVTRVHVAVYLPALPLIYDRCYALVIFVAVRGLHTLYTLRLRYT